MIYEIFIDTHKFKKPAHLPKFKWWQLFIIRKVKTNGQRLAYNIWIYTRWGSWCHGYVPPAKEGKNK